MKENGSDTSRYLDLFLSESREHMDQIEAELIRLPNDDPSTMTINELFRHAHSLKGMSASMGFGSISVLADALEDIFTLLKKKERNLGPSLRSLLMESVEKINTILASIEMTGKEPEPEIHTVHALRDVIRSGYVREEKKPMLSTPSPRSAKGRTFELEIVFMRDAPLLSARAVLTHKKLSERGDIIEMTPGLEQIRSGSFDGTLSIVIRTLLNQERLEKTIRSLAEVEKFRIIPVAEAARMQEAQEDPVLPSSVRVKTAYLDSFLDDCVELMIQRERLLRMMRKKGESEAVYEAEKMGMTIKKLHAELMKVRMLPFSYISRRFERSVRELSQSLNKTVALKIFGGETEMDKSILEEISDPINHLLRNSIDHGIEAPEARKKAGKTETGTISISLGRTGDSVIITIEDDGAGIDVEKVKRVALEAQYITKDEYRSMKESDAYVLVTIPGFSTTQKLTAVSGRGIGLDAVRTKIENIAGKMRIGPRVGGGTIVEFTLPLTVAVISAFIIRDKQRLFAIPVSNIEKTLHALPSEIIHKEQGIFITQNGTLAQILELSALLDEKDSVQSDEHARQLLIFKDGERAFALAVDEIMYRKDIIVKPLSPPLDQMRKYTGASFLEDGTIALILDIQNLLRT